MTGSISKQHVEKSPLTKCNDLLLHDTGALADPVDFSFCVISVSLGMFVKIRRSLLILITGCEDISVKRWAS